MLQKLISPDLSICLVFFLCCSLFSCGGGGDGGSSGDNSDSIGTIQINTDPYDSEVAILTGYADGDILKVYGTKDDNGAPTQIETLQYFIPGQSEPVNIVVDEFGRPSYMSTPEGYVYAFTYYDDKFTVTCRDSEGNLSIEDFSLEDVDLPLVNNRPARADDAEIAGILTENNIFSVEEVNGTIKVKAYTDLSSELGLVNANNIKISATDINETRNVAYAPIGTGTYRFTAQHRVANLEVPVAACQEHVKQSEYLFGVLASAATIVALLMAPEVIVFGISGQYLFSGMGLLFGATALASNRVDCKDYIINKLTDLGAGKQSVKVEVTYKKESDQQTKEYDLIDPSDQVNINREIEFTFGFTEKPNIINISTIPKDPRVGQSYDLVVEAYLPEDGAIEYDWIREDDGRSRSGKWDKTGEDAIVKHTFENFIAADRETTDKITVRLFVLEGGQHVQYGKDMSKHIDIKSGLCPVGRWTSKEIDYIKATDECKPQWYHYASFEIMPDGHWLSLGDIDTDETSTWTLTGDHLILEGLPTSSCSRRYYEGTVLDFGNGCTRIEGKMISECYLEGYGNFTAIKCWEADFN